MTDPKEKLLRRVAHVLLCFGVLYYWLPDPVLFDIPRNLGLIGAAALACVIEYLRIKRLIRLHGMRDYEERRMSGFLYAVLGMVIVLWATPEQIGIPCIFGMALCDPLAGELRCSGTKESMTAAYTAISYALISFCTLVAAGVQGAPLLALIGAMTPLAVIAEQLDLKHLDDDFTMLVIPAAAAMLILTIA